MSYTTRVFGWKASLCAYQTIGMGDTSYRGSLWIQTLQDIDARIATEINLDNDPLKSCLNDISLPGEAVAYGLLDILTRLRYALSLKKSNLIPSTCIMTGF